MIGESDTKEEHEKIIRLVEEWIRSGASSEESFAEWMQKRVAG